MHCDVLDDLENSAIKIFKYLRQIFNLSIQTYNCITLLNCILHINFKIFKFTYVGNDASVINVGDILISVCRNYPVTRKQISQEDKSIVSIKNNVIVSSIRSFTNKITGINFFRTSHLLKHMYLQLNSSEI